MVRRVVSWVVSQNPAGEGVPGQRIAALNHIAQNWNDSKQTAKKTKKLKPPSPKIYQPPRENPVQVHSSSSSSSAAFFLSVNSAPKTPGAAVWVEQVIL